MQAADTEAHKEPTSPSKRILDLVNSAAWFTMDAFWIFEQEWAAYVAAGITILTGLVLLVMAWGHGWGELYADLGVNCWIGMNTIWMVSDLNGHKTPPALVGPFVALGALFILAAACHSQDFRRLRVFRR